MDTDGYGAVVLDLDGSVVGEQWVDADMANADERAIFARLDELALQQEEALAKKGYVLAGTGLALPGLVTDDLRLLGARNLGWER